MAKIGGGFIGGVSRSKSIKLNDTAGTDSFTIKDSDGFTIFQVTSDGTIKTKGGIQRV